LISRVAVDAGFRPDPDRALKTLMGQWLSGKADASLVKIAFFGRFAEAARQAIQGRQKLSTAPAPNKMVKDDRGLFAAPGKLRRFGLRLGKFFDSFLLRQRKPLCNVLGLHRPRHEVNQ